jgi:alkylhydroperoxidase family enzyme
VRLMAFATWLPVAPGTEVLDLVPKAGDALRALYGSLRGAGVDPAVLGEVRAAIDATIGTRPRVGGDALDAATKAAVMFSEQYVVDAHGVTDEQAQALHASFTDEQLAVLTTALATFDAIARVRAVLASPVGTPATFTLEEE